MLQLTLLSVEADGEIVVVFFAHHHNRQTTLLQMTHHPSVLTTHATALDDHAVHGAVQTTLLQMTHHASVLTTHATALGHHAVHGAVAEARLRTDHPCLPVNQNAAMTIHGIRKTTPESRLSAANLLEDIHVRRFVHRFVVHRFVRRFVMVVGHVERTDGDDNPEDAPENP